MFRSFAVKPNDIVSLAINEILENETNLHDIVAVYLRLKKIVLFNWPACGQVPQANRNCSRLEKLAKISACAHHNSKINHYTGM